MKRVLMIGDVEVQSALKIVSYSEAHPYYPKDSVPPGHMPQHILEIPHGFRSVYSQTHIEQQRFRHLSVSVTQAEEDKAKYAHPECVIMIAKLFGFTGKSTDLNVGINHNERSVVVWQQLL